MTLAIDSTPIFTALSCADAPTTREAAFLPLRCALYSELLQLAAGLLEEYRQVHLVTHPGR